MSSYDFYDRVLEQAENSGVLTKDRKILVVCGGQFDRAVLLRRGYTNVVISNIGKQIAEHPHDQDVDEQSDDYEPFHHALIDAEDIAYSNNSFDVVIEHLGLHHCHSPHKAVTEMYRVAKRGIVFIENRDSALIRLATMVGLSSEYEIEAVLSNDYRFGGVANTDIPNYVYRWTEAEVDKTIRSYDPKSRPSINYVYGLRSPGRRLRRSRNRLKIAVGTVLAALASVFQMFLPRQCNMFGVVVAKPEGSERLWPWIKLDHRGKASIDQDWCRERFREDRAYSRRIGATANNVGDDSVADLHVFDTTIER